MKKYIIILISLLIFCCKKTDESAIKNSIVNDSTTTETASDSGKKAPPVIETASDSGKNEPSATILQNVLRIPLGDAILRFNNVYGAEHITLDSIKSVDTLEMFVSEQGGIAMSLHNGLLLCDVGTINSISVKTRVSHSVAIGYDGSSGITGIKTITPVYSSWNSCKNDSIAFRLPEFDYHITTDIFSDSILSLAQTALDIEKSSNSSAELTAFVYSLELEITNGESSKTVICNFTEL